MMMMKSVFWWRKLEYPEETTDLWQVTDETSMKSYEYVMKIKVQAKAYKPCVIHHRKCDMLHIV